MPDTDHGNGASAHGQFAASAGSGSFYRSGYFAGAVALFAALAMAQFLLVSGLPTFVVAVVLLLPMFDTCLLQCMRVKAASARTPNLPRADPDARVRWPAVSVVMPSHEEPFDVKKMTMDSVLAMDYPGEIEFVSVDSSHDPDDPDLLAWEDGVLGSGGVYLHNPRHDALKAGNVDLALGVLTGEYVLFVDVDSTMPADSSLIAQALRDFDDDPQLAFVQFHVVPTNAGFNAFTRGAARQLHLHNATDLVGGEGGFVTFKGHNALWRRSVLEQAGAWREDFRGRPMLVEDFLKACDAYRLGYHGLVSWADTGEWVPGSVRAFRTMWTRWTYGTLEVVVKRKLWDLRRSRGGTVFDRIEMLRRASFGTFMVPYLAVLAAVAVPAPVFLPYLALRLAALVTLNVASARLDDRMGRRPSGWRRVGAHLVTVAAEHLVAWVAFLAQARFLRDSVAPGDRRLTWTVTAKAVGRRQTWTQAVSGDLPFQLGHTVLVVLCAGLLLREPGDLSTILIRGYALFFFLSPLLLTLCLSQADRRAGDEARTATIERRAPEDKEFARV